MTMRVFAIQVVLLWLWPKQTKAFVPLQPPGWTVAANDNRRFIRHRSHETQLGTTNEGKSIPLSTSELLAELDARNIRYPPNATRKKLESLLNADDVVNNNDVMSTNVLKPKELSVMVKELLDKGVRIPPYASRTDLECLWLEEMQKSPRATKRVKKQHREIPRILKELDELGIPYPPGASPRMLVQLLENHQEIPPPTRRRRRPRSEAVTMNAYSTQQRRSTADILEKLRDSGIRFSPTATRKELEELLQREQDQSEAFRDEDDFAPFEKVTNDDPLTSPQNMDDSTETEVGQETDIESVAAITELRAHEKDDQGSQLDEESMIRNAPIRDDPVHVKGRSSSSPQPKERLSRRARLKMQTKPSIWSKLYGRSVDGVLKKLDFATTRLSHVADRAARTARFSARRARDFFLTDENGIRDVHYEYVNKEKVVIIEAPSVSTVNENPNVAASSSVGNKRYRREQSAEPPFTTGQPRERRNPSKIASNPATGKEIMRRPRGARDLTNVASQSGLFRLPPAVEPKVEKDPPSARRRQGGKRATDPSRRVYSPYDDGSVPSQVYRDSIDRMAEFLVNAADTILWGRLDEETYDNGTGRPPKAKPNKSDAKSPGPHSSAADPADGSRVSWRDRLEERFDSMLGIHEKGEYYNRWAEQEEREDREALGNDAFSVARGVAPKRRHGRKKSKVFDKPFWEQQNLISSLFGRTPPNGYSNVEPGNLLPFLNTSVKSLLLFANNACNWASVRGSLPQPVVVVGVTSSILCARPGKRILTGALSLLAFRIFGELIHEGLYGGEDWEENYDGDVESEFDDGLQRGKGDHD